MRTMKENKIARVIMKDGDVRSIEPLARVSDIEQRKEQFDNVMANINPLLMEGEGKNKHMVTATASVPLNCCFVDTRYQGMRTHKNIKKLIDHWDIRYLAPIILVPHPEEYRFAIADGQARSIVAPLKGMDRLTATILMDAPEDPDERLKFEARYFIGQDTEVENVKDYEKHLARVILGDPAAVTMERLMNKYNVKYVSKQGKRSESVLGSYSDTYSITKVRGEKCLEFIFSIIDKAGWNNEPNGYATFIIRAMKDIWIAHPDDRNEIHRFLSNELRQLSPALFSARAKVKYPNRDKACCSLYLEDMVCDNLFIEKKIYMDGTRKCKVFK